MTRINRSACRHYAEAALGISALPVLGPLTAYLLRRAQRAGRAPLRVERRGDLVGYSFRLHYLDRVEEVALSPEYVAASDGLSAPGFVRRWWHLAEHEWAGYLHDALYSARYPRDLADLVLLVACLQVRLPPHRANLIWLAVRLFGGTHYPAAPVCASIVEIREMGPSEAPTATYLRPESPA